MGNASQFADIILFAMIAVFLVLRLRSVLGRRGDEEPPRPGLFARDEATLDPKKQEPVPEPDRSPDRSNVVEFPDKGRPPPLHQPSLPVVERGVVRIREVDSGFDAESFLVGARAAFELIVTAFAAGDKKALHPLLSEEVMENFSHAIDVRNRAQQISETQLVGPPLAEIIDADLSGSVARVTVRYLSEQINVLRDAAGAVVEGDPNYVAKVIDVWTFSRDTRAQDPNWLLVATGSVD
ncbi:MAG: Tim44/TimA family putative adaptor protein [Alphaproteobacteria bacterium]